MKKKKPKIPKEYDHHLPKNDAFIHAYTLKHICIFYCDAKLNFLQLQNLISKQVWRRHIEVYICEHRHNSVCHSVIMGIFHCCFGRYTKYNRMN